MPAAASASRRQGRRQSPRQSRSAGSDRRYGDATVKLLIRTALAEVGATPGPQATSPAARRKGASNAPPRSSVTRALRRTMTLSRTMLLGSYRRSSRRLKVAVVLLVLGAALFVGLTLREARARRSATERLRSLLAERGSAAEAIGTLESALASARQRAPGSPEALALLTRLRALERQTAGLDRALATAEAPGSAQATRTRAGLRAILTTFGAADRAIPELMIARTERFLRAYTRGGAATARALLARARTLAPTLAAPFVEAGLPVDLVAVAGVESVYRAGAKSGAGAVGLWQFLGPTAREYGLKTRAPRDERRDPARSSRAAAAFLGDLIAVFGGRNFELALAAYNCGGGRVRGALKRVRHPLRDRSYWSLYQLGYLPEETAQYVPKILAVMLILRAPGAYGLAGPDPFAAYR